MESNLTAGQCGKVILTIHKNDTTIVGMRYNPKSNQLVVDYDGATKLSQSVSYRDTIELCAANGVDLIYNGKNCYGLVKGKEDKFVLAKGWIQLKGEFKSVPDVEDTYYVPDVNAPTWNTRDCAYQILLDHGRFLSGIRYSDSKKLIVVEAPGWSSGKGRYFIGIRFDDMSELCEANGVKFEAAGFSSVGIKDGVLEDGWIQVL